MTRWTTVQISVPEDRVGGFYEAFGKWLDAGASERNSVAFSTEAEYTPRDYRWREGSAEERTQDAICLYESLSPLSRRILDYWIDTNARRVKADQIVTALGLNSVREVAGSLSSFTLRDRKCGNRKLPFMWEELESGTEYWMSDDIKELFRSARDLC